MDKSHKKILYNIYDNNNINTEIKMNSPINESNSLKISINKQNNIPRVNKNKNNNKNNRNSKKKFLKNQNNINKKNYFYSYNNIINNFPIKTNDNLEKDKYFVSEVDNLNINKTDRYQNRDPIILSPSNSPEKRSRFLNFNQNIINEDDYDDEILTMKYNEVKKLHKLFDENIELKNEIKLLKKEIENIKNINKVNVDIINSKCSEIYKINENSKKLKEKIDELYKTININNNIILKLHEEKFNLEKELNISKQEIIKKNNKITHNEINENNIESKIKISNIKNKNEISNLSRYKENNNANNKNNILNDNNIKLLSQAELKNSLLNKNKCKRVYSAEKQTEYIQSRILGKIKSKSISNIKRTDNFEIVEKSDSKNNISSTPSFKSMEEENEELGELKNELKEDVQNEIRNENFNIKYFENKYLYYFKLYQECKKMNEILKKELTKKEELIHKLKNDINYNINQKNEQNNNNNLMTTFSEIKINYQYNSNEFFILCDKVYGELKWYLMKKQIDYEKEDTYDNLIWVPKIDVVDLDKFNEYSNEDENSNSELLKVIKKLEEKENIISKLTYKVEKLEKDIDNYKNNSDFSDIYDEIFVKSKRKSRNNSKSKNS